MMKESWRIDAAYRVISLHSNVKVLIATIADMMVLALSTILASWLVTEFDSSGLTTLTLLAPPTVVFFLYVAGAYKAITRFIGMEFVERGAVAIALATVAVGSACWVTGMKMVSWNLMVLFGLIGFCLLLMNRLLAKRLLRPVLKSRGIVNVLIYGAGDAGTQLASALAINCHYRAVGFIDDRSMLQGRTLLGLPVYSSVHLPMLKERNAFERVLLAIPSATRARRRVILENLEALAVKVLVMPGMEDLANGQKQVDELREVQIEDLLERDPVTPVESLLNLFIKDKAVMVTGAGGSIGSELCRQVVKQGASKLVLVEVCEFALYKIDRELREEADLRGCTIIPVLNTALDGTALQRVMQLHGVETVYHAAAYKHVPLVEDNVVSAVRNNVVGTLNTAQAALRAGVRNFVLISTDKAVRPTNVMGASKRMCELIVQALAVRNPGMSMSMVRFGNVLASSGSVVPLFREQIQRGGPVTVTHPDVTRYFMTIPEAAQLVIQAGSMGHHGEVFLLEMGRPVKIRQLAERMIHLSGLTVKDAETQRGDIEIQYSGLRPGEKLYEELLIGESPQPTEHARIFKAQESCLEWERLSPLLDTLINALEQGDEQVIVGVLQACVSGFDRRSNRVLPATSEIQSLKVNTEPSKVTSIERPSKRPAQILLPGMPEKDIAAARSTQAI